MVLVASGRGPVQNPLIEDLCGLRPHTSQNPKFPCESICHFITIFRSFDLWKVIAL